MNGLIKINESISYIKATREPLSSDVVIISGGDFTYFYDVGCSNNAYNTIKSFSNKKKVIISHFHPDHMSNLQLLNFEDTFVGKNTYKYTGFGTVVEDELIIHDKNRICIFPMPSSHAKGCLACEVNEQYLFVGDALYPQRKNNKALYNVQHIYSQLKFLEKTKAEYIGVSHNQDFIIPKDKIINNLERLYSRRNSNSPYIEADINLQGSL